MKTTFRYIRPEDLAEKIRTVGKSVHVTEGHFSTDVPGKLEDMEWNHMDQMHRPFIHKTYEDGIRIATGPDSALSLTRWGKWPLFLTVTDVRIKTGLYYQTMVIGGLIYMHNIISQVEENEVVHLKVQWLIASHKWLRFLHPVLSRKLYRLNVRLQEEDAVIRGQRYALRKKGYCFASEPVNFYTSNALTNNTIYPKLPEDAHITVADIAPEQLNRHALGPVEFLTRRDENAILIWPGVCPHEGAKLADGCMLEDKKLQCPWHGLKFQPIRLTAERTSGAMYGFSYHLEPDRIVVKQLP